MTDGQTSQTYVSRGGLKLQAALARFGLSVTGMRCVDLGCNVGGFTDCLLQHGAASVLAIDTGYGALAWRLRQDPRVAVFERTNALHIDPGSLSDQSVPCDLVVVDMGWTRQSFALQAAARWQPSHIISLLKPHYEARPRQKAGRQGVLDAAASAEVARQVIDRMPDYGMCVVDWFQSPILGGKGKGKRGNIEYLLHLQPIGSAGSCG